MKYFLYARKSEEDHKRQIESIPRQMKQLAERFPECEIVDTFTEEMSAKKPGRPYFSQMIARIEREEADGILVWSINRLLRNPVDQGTIQWLLQTKRLKSVKTMEKEYTPKDNVLILNIDAGVSNQFIKDLIEHTVAALNEKVEMGWFPHRAPEGYLNDTSKLQGQRDIIIDPIRFPLLRLAWDMILTGSYSVMDVFRYLEVSGYRAKPYAKSSNGKMSRSALYRLFTNRFYAGYFKHNGEWHRGKHPQMVSEAEFDRVQTILGKTTRVKRELHTYAYAGLIRCGRCRCQVGGETRSRTICGGGVKIHTYYACSNGKRICNKKCITADKLEDQFASKLDGISVNPRYRNLLLSIWRRYFDESNMQDERIVKSQQAVLSEKRKAQGRLLDLRLQDLVDIDQFKEKKAAIDQEIEKLERDSQEIGGVDDKKYQDTENVLLFMTEPKDRYKILLPEDKRTVALHLGFNYLLTEGKLVMELNKMLIPAAQFAKEFEVDCATFERSDCGSESNKKAAFDRLFSHWGHRWDQIRINAIEDNLYFQRINM